MTQTVTALNRNWLFCDRDHASYADPHRSERAFAPVNLPHSNTALPANYFSERRTQFVSWYRKHIPTPARLNGGRVFVDFDGVMMTAEVFVNGKPALTHRGGYVGFSVDATPFLLPRAGADNVLTVRVDSRLDPDIPPCGKVMDYQTFGGIYRDVRLRVTPACFLNDLFIQTPMPLERQKTIRAVATVQNSGPSAMDVVAALELLDLQGRRIAAGPAQPCAIAVGGETSVTLEWAGLTGLKLWDLDAPHLYRARVVLSEKGRPFDRIESRFGFRDIRFSKEGPFLLNGQPVKLIGLNRHQTFPHIGAAAPARLQRRDAELLKYEYGCAIMRTSHYPQSPHFLDRCDEIGLLVFEEAPGWGHIGDAGWKDLFCRDVEMMIRRDRNHPSIVLWGVRVNESGDDHDFYARTNALARALDSTRPTGGVRWGVNSEFLEDVFTANDYSYAPPKIINEPPTTPYLITESGIIMDFRRTATCELLLKHAMNHAEIQNAVMGNPKISGNIAWCAFDYHSQDWVTTDGIQPWGVADVFRAPKLAAAFYASQLDPAVRPVLQAATRWKVGDQAGFDPNENTMKSGHDASLVVFSNCDRVEVRIGGETKGFFEPARRRFPHLAHPPIVCTGLGTLWGPSWKDLHVLGYVGSRQVAEQRFPATHEAPILDLTVDDRELTADGSDMTRLLLRHTDAFGNAQPHSRVVVSLEMSGPASLIGPNPCALAGGVTGLYLRAGTKPGLVKVTARASELGQTQTVTVRITSPLSPRRAAIPSS